MVRGQRAANGFFGAGRAGRLGDPRGLHLRERRVRGGVPAELDDQPGDCKRRGRRRDGQHESDGRASRCEGSVVGFHGPAKAMLRLLGLRLRGGRLHRRIVELEDLDELTGAPVRQQRERHRKGETKRRPGRALRILITRHGESPVGETRRGVHVQGKGRACARHCAPAPGAGSTEYSRGNVEYSR